MLGPCLRSILAGTRLPDEIIVVDQSRDEETRRVVESVDSELIRYERHSPASISGARNHALKVAGGEYVAIVDDDCEMPPDWLVRIEAESERHGHPDALYGEIRNPTPDPLNKALTVSIHEPEVPREWSYPANPDQFGFGAHMILRRQTFLELGGFDERLGPGAALLGGEDLDFSYRLIKAGHRAVTTPAIWVLHHQWRPQKELPRFFYGRQYGYAAFCAKHLRGGDRYALRLFAISLGNQLRLLASAARRRSWRKARAAFWMVVGTFAGLVRGWREYAT